jgi:hypothetical protein
MSCGERTGAVFHYLTASRSVGKAKRGSRDTGKIVSSREVRALLQGSLLYLDLTGTRNGRSLIPGLHPDRNFRSLTAYVHSNVVAFYLTQNG